MKGTAGGQEDQAVRWEVGDLRLLVLSACQLCQPQNMNIKAGCLMDNQDTRGLSSNNETREKGMGAGRVMARKLWPTHLLQDQEQGQEGGEGPELLSDLEAARCMAKQEAGDFYLWTAVRPSCFISHPP